MTELLLEGNDWRTWIENTEAFAGSSTAARPPDPLRHAAIGGWDATDRPLHVPAQPRPSAPSWQGANSGTAASRAARAQWMRRHGVSTQFLDAGIGTCWFAQQGDDEPVCGETEDAAITRLARQNGLPWGETGGCESSE